VCVASSPGARSGARSGATAATTTATGGGFGTRSSARSGSPTTSIDGPANCRAVGSRSDARSGNASAGVQATAGGIGTRSGARSGNAFAYAGVIAFVFGTRSSARSGNASAHADTQPVLGGVVIVAVATQQIEVSRIQTQSVAVSLGDLTMYYVNTNIRLTFTFKDFDGVTLVDPSTVSLLIDGATVVPDRLSQGVYSYVYLPTAAGRKTGRISGTGAIAATRPFEIVVLPD